MLFSNVNVQLLFAVVLIIAANATDYERGVACVTPNDENATCVPLNECTVLYNAVFNPTPETNEFLKKSKCASNTTLVCCGSSAYPKNPPPPQAEKIQLSALSDETVCGMHALASYKISGGLTADFPEFPWVAALEYKSKFSNTTAIRCGGSLINDKYVLTAAHCTGHIEFELIKVWLGATNITTDDNCIYYPTGKRECINSIQKYNVDIPIVHPHYVHFKKTNDIALLRLEKKIIFTHYIRPICLLSSNSPSLRSGTYLTVAGWGTTEDHKQSDIKLKVDVPVQDDSICNEFLVMQELMVDSNQLCVGGETGKDSCEGDSGGPLMTNFKTADKKTQWYQEGLVSYGVGCADNKRPTIYTRVAKYESWIATQIYLLNINLKRGSTCTTPNQEQATCVSVHDCAVINDAVATRNQSAIDFAKQSQCGFDTDLLVCCGTTAFPIQVEVDPFDIFTRQPPTDKNHINLNFVSGTTLPDRALCGLERNTPSLRGGPATDIDEHPWMALIRYQEDNGIDAGFRCGGTLINNRFVLTAAHCILTQAEVFRPKSVRLGEWRISTEQDCVTSVARADCSEPVVDVQIVEQIPHPFYSARSGNNDIGLLRMERDVKYTDFIRPICLPPTNLPTPAMGTIMTVCGWGGTENGSLSDVKLKIDIPIVSGNKCAEILSRNVFANKICAGGIEGKDACQGDSGGPLMTTYPDAASQWYQEGVAGRGRECGKKSYTSVYTRVSRYVTWIINILEDN